MPDIQPTNQTPETPQPEADDFAKQASEPNAGLLREYLDFLKSSKKWWLTPIIVFLLLLGVLVVLGGTGVAPFIYTLF